MQLGRKKGSVGLQTYAGKEAYFSNFTYRVNETGTAISAAKSRIPPRNVIAQRRLSPSYQVPSLDAIADFPARRMAQTKDWITPEMDASGLVNITRYHGRTGKVRRPPEAPDCSILRTYIDSEQAKQVMTTFGYSDAATIFLNQTPLYWGNCRFSEVFPPFRLSHVA